jgi:flagellar basal body-associated protein FliL
MAGAPAGKSRLVENIRKNFFDTDYRSPQGKIRPGKKCVRIVTRMAESPPMVHSTINIFPRPPSFPWKILWRNDSTQSTPQPEKKGWGLGTKILLLLIVIVVVVSLLAVITISVAVLNQPTGSSFPYTTTYRVSLPDGETVTIGNSKILVLTMGNEVDTSVDGSKERLAIGQERTISARYARISAIGTPVIDTDFQIVLKYIGSSGNNALFDMKIMTSRQVPEILIRQLIPPGMGAQPI